jgi:MFS family permease
MLLSYLGPSVACYWPDVVGPFQESLLTSVVFAGMMVGVYSLGLTADVLGRRKGFFLSASILGIAGAASAFAPSFGVLLFLRIIVGMALGGTPIAVTLFSEFLPTARRGSLVLGLQAAWSIGTIFEALLAWLVLPSLGWRWLLIFSAVPMGILLVGYPWLPESPHWLASQGRMKEAEDVVARVARVNNKNNGSNTDRGDTAAASSTSPGARTSLRRHVVPRTTINTTTSSNSNHTTNNSHSPSSWWSIEGLSKIKNQAQQTLPKIFSPHLAKTTSLLWAIWLINALTYYGLVLLTTSIQASSSRNNANISSVSSNSDGDGGDEQQHARCTPDGRPNFTSSDYLAVLITSAAEAPGLAAAAFFIDGKGRVWCLRAALLLCSACVLTLLAVPTDATSSTSWSSSIQLGLLFTARASIEASFSALYVYTPELYSTSIRAQGLALCNAFSRLGGFLAPFATVYLVESGRTGAAELLLGVLLLVAAGAAMALPFETKGIDLGEEIDTFLAENNSTGAEVREIERERLISQEGIEVQ